MEIIAVTKRAHSTWPNEAHSVGVNLCRNNVYKVSLLADEQQTIFWRYNEFTGVGIGRQVAEWVVVFTVLMVSSDILQRPIWSKVMKLKEAKLFSCHIGVYTNLFLVMRFLIRTRYYQKLNAKLFSFFSLASIAIHF